MPVGFMTVGLDGRVQRMNETARRIMGNGVQAIANIDERPCFLPILQQLDREETVVEREIRCPTSGSESVPLLINAARIRDSRENTTGCMILFSDITRIKALEEQVRRSERLASLGRLAAGIAHEIRNPLSSIKGFATILAKRNAEDERSRKISEVMVQEVERLNRVISELLDFARPTELHREQCAIGELFRRTLPLIEGEAAERKVKIESGTDPEELGVEIDPDRFAQILLNLCLNAVQAMEGGGVLKVEGLQRGPQTLVRVSDSGPGISSEDLPHIFDPYFTTKPNGVGLGLANVHKLVEAHGGKIEVESPPGHGTTFTISLPARGSIEAGPATS
jgi:two-component system sensor histidine kinase HydH